jgi:hypothetical protein
MQDILVFAGSARTNAFSKKLAKSAALSIRRRTPIRARATLIDLADFDAPLFNADLEFLQGVPESMQAIKAMVRSHDGLLIVTPNIMVSFRRCWSICSAGPRGPSRMNHPAWCFRASRWRWQRPARGGLAESG